MKRAHADRTLVALLALLVTAGILIFLSASLSLILKGGGAFASALVSQLVLGLCGGVAALLVTLRTPLVLVRRFAPHAFVIAVVATLLVFVPHIGISANGAHRWINLGIITFQPSELLKIAYVLLLAAFLARGKLAGAELKTGILPFVGLTAVSGVVLLLQPDTDTFLIMVAAGVAMLFAAGARLAHIAALALVGCVMVAGLLFARPYLWDRVQTFIDPSRDPLGSGYQIQQSLIAVGSGDVWGSGYGTSIQKFNYLPEASSDSIFAVFAEEFGFFGSVLLVAGYLAFALRGMWVAARAHELFGGLVALGIVVLIVSQAFLNIAAMIGIAPVGGIPLPFVSRGGSALLMVLLMAGLVLNVSRTVRT